MKIYTSTLSNNNVLDKNISNIKTFIHKIPKIIIKWTPMYLDNPTILEK